MIINYQRRTNFTKKEIDYIEQSTTNPSIKRLIYRHKHTEFYNIATMLILYTVSILSVIICFNAALAGYKLVFWLCIILLFMIAYSIILFIFAKHSKFNIIYGGIYNTLKYFNAAPKTREMNRRLLRYYRIEISDKDYRAINALYVSDYGTFNGLHFVKINSENIIYFNPVGDYIYDNTCHYAQIIDYIQRCIKI